jgi:hypothetical protein
MKPVCFAAMENRSMEAYTILFTALKQASANVGFDLHSISHMMDFEVAAVKASKKIFADVKISFCHFHFAKAIWRKIQKTSECVSIID